MTDKLTLVVDVDGTLCEIVHGGNYKDAAPKIDVIEAVNRMYAAGHVVILHSARGMRTYAGDINQIEKHIRPVMEAWLRKHNVKYHVLVLGKPWGKNVRYIDDNAMHIHEFLELTNE